MKIFISPHNDDAVLFGSFTIQREKLMVLTVFDSYRQVERGHEACSRSARRREDTQAMKELGQDDVFFGGVPDNLPPDLIEKAVRLTFEDYAALEIWVPAEEQGGNEQHNLVARVGPEMFPRAKTHRYLTYTAAGKSTFGVPVQCTGAMVRKKLRALACYQTQIEIDELGTWPHFLRDQHEYLLPE